MIPVSEGFTRKSTVSDVRCQEPTRRSPLGTSQSRESVDASESRATIRDRCFGKGKEKAKMLKTLADPAGGRLVLGGGIGTVILVVLYLLLGGDPQALFNSQQAQLPQSAQIDTQAPRDEASKFVAVVLADTEDAWNEIFRQMGREYRGAKAGALHGHDSVRLRVRQRRDRSVLLSARSTRLHRPRFFPSTPGTPGCRRRFRRGLRYRARSWTSRAESARHYRSCGGSAPPGQSNPNTINQLSVRLELQADFLAGVWARYADRVKHVVEAGDIEEAMRAASAVGDDRLSEVNLNDPIRVIATCVIKPHSIHPKGVHRGKTH